MVDGYVNMAVAWTYPDLASIRLPHLTVGPGLRWICSGDGLQQPDLKPGRIPRCFTRCVCISPNGLTIQAWVGPKSTQAKNVLASSINSPHRSSSALLSISRGGNLSVIVERVHVNKVVTRPSGNTCQLTERNGDCGHQWDIATYDQRSSSPFPVPVSGMLANGVLSDSENGI